MKTKIAIILTLIFLPLSVIAESAVFNINNQIQTKKAEIKKLESQLDAYKKAIIRKQSQASSLVNELEILEDKIARAELNIQLTENKLGEVGLEIQKIDEEIEEKEEQTVSQKNKLSEFIRKIAKQDNKNFLEILVLNNSLSSFFDQLKNLQNLQNQLQKNLNRLQIIQAELGQKNRELGEKKGDLENLKISLEQNKNDLLDQSNYKDTLLVETKKNEKKYQSLLAELKQQQDRANSEIYSLEKQLRGKLASEEKFASLTNDDLSWPVNPSRGITAYFHDPTYPFRYLFEHPGVDVRAYQGTKIYAATSGYVAKARDNGLGYSYIMLIHANSFSTVYGHISKFYVKQGEYVSKGEVIGLTGGMPGTPGAGRLSTGPHLHFEVRINGIPVDPLGYMP